jgi:hypothetical protein
VTLKAHIESGAPDAWKAGIRVLEPAFAKAESGETFRFPASIEEIERMSWTQSTFVATTLTTRTEENGVGAGVMEGTSR